MTQRRLLWAIAAVLLAGLAAGLFFFPRDPFSKHLLEGEVLVLRTPGGMLEVSTVVKNESFAWSTSHTCPIIDCSALIQPTISDIRLPAHYTYRIPLAATWRLTRHGAGYELVVPRVEPKLPAAADFSKMEMHTTKGWLSPGAQANREVLLRELGPELNRRAAAPGYVEAQRADAKKTVEEFARKWMVQQEKAGTLAGPIKVRFADESPVDPQ
ncbi:MAG: hypothetical protein HYX47_18510 [Burkholderiales bacterium]|nr:hypothetical protein [Burkholderiales bacterium]